ncbi:response regulator [Deinococcus misasensis]|uniref:response regulator n=1 Tax=Deinococcus misasensis TaxID=392413 RepID=UPI00068B779B|nr:response regulator [Deinococcus misasensis]
MASNPKILVIDDQNVNLILIEKALRSGEYQNIVTTSNPEDGLNRILHDKPDLVLLDLIMPRLNGLEILEQLRSVTEKLPPILVVTSENSENMQQKALDAGARQVIKKPFQRAELLDTVRQWLSYVY